MKKLIKGIIDFRKNRLADYREKFAKLALGQSPDTLFIACSDSRVVPNLFASTDPGDLFVIRNVGNLIPPCDSEGRSGGENSAWAAIEFSILQLNVTDIVVCGHSECGAVHSIIEGREKVAGEHLKSWLAYGEDAPSMLSRLNFSENTLAEHNKVSQANVLLQLDHLKSYPLIEEKMREGKLQLHAWWFDISSGNVLSYSPSAHRFDLITG